MGPRNADLESLNMAKTKELSGVPPLDKRSFRGFRPWTTPTTRGLASEQCFEIHGSTGAPLPEKKLWMAEKNRRMLEKNPQEKKRVDSEC